MADKTRRYLPSDWTIWTYTPEPGKFVLNYSVLDTGILGSANGTIVQNTEDIITALRISEGTQINQGIVGSIEPSTASIMLNTSTLNTNIADKYLVGQEIWITLKNEETVDDKTYNKNTPFFRGFITSFALDFEPGSKFANISLEAISKTSAQLNRQMAVVKNTTDTKQVVLTSAYQANGITLIYLPYAMGDYHYGSTATETKAVGEWLEDFRACQFYIATETIINNSSFSNDTPKIGLSYQSFMRFVSPDAPTSSEVTFNESDIINAGLDWSGRDAPTAVTLTNYTNNSLVYNKGNSTDDTIGANNFTLTTDVKDSIEMEKIGLKALSMLPKFTPITITVKDAETYQNITFKEVPLSISGTLPVQYQNHYLYPNKYVKVGSAITVNMPDYGINEIMLVTGKTISVTPDNWQTTYNLWKGFSN